jgi:hypothetical protein
VHPESPLVSVAQFSVRPFDTSHAMSDAAPPFWIQALGTLGTLVLIIGIVAWGMRRNRNEFRLYRVLGVAFASLLASLPFVAAFWWISPNDVDRHSPWLLAAVFVPVFILEAWGISIMIRRRRQRFHEHTTA